MHICSAVRKYKIIRDISKATPWCSFSPHLPKASLRDSTYVFCFKASQLLTPLTHSNFCFLLLQWSNMWQPRILSLTHNYKKQRTSKEMSTVSDTSDFSWVLLGISIFQPTVLIEKGDLFSSTARRNHIILRGFQHS